MDGIGSFLWPAPTCLIAGAVCCFLVGCQDAAREPLFPVKGQVRLEGQILSTGSVSLRPDEPGRWQHPTGLIGADGVYSVFTDHREGAPPGRYKVVVFAHETLQSRAGTAAPGLPKSLISTRYHDPQTTPLAINVVAQPAPGAYDLELKTHAQ